MAPIEWQETSYVEHEPLTWYPATVQAVEENVEGNYGPQLKMILNLDGELNEDGSYVETWAYCPQKLGSRTKLFRWLAGIYGKENVPRTFDPQALVGTKIEVMFVRYTGQDSDGSPVEKEKVGEMKAATGVAAPNAAPQRVTDGVPSATSVAATPVVAAAPAAPSEIPF